MSHSITFTTWLNFSKFTIFEFYNFRIHIFRNSHFTKFTFFEIHIFIIHIFWNSHFSKFTFFEIHIFRNSHLSKFTFFEIHIYRNSHLSKFTFIEIHIYRNSHLSKFTVFEIHIFRNSHFSNFTFFRYLDLPHWDTNSSLRSQCYKMRLFMQFPNSLLRKSKMLLQWKLFRISVDKMQKQTDQWMQIGCILKQNNQYDGIEILLHLYTKSRILQGRCEEIIK